MKIDSVVAIAAMEAAIKRLGIKLTANTVLEASATKQLGISYEAKILPITMAIELGHFLIESEFFGSVDVYDGTGAIDEFMIDFFKTLTDNPKFADNAVNAFNKVLADNPAVADIDVLHFYKSLADIATTSDTHRYDLVKPLIDGSATADAHAYVFNKDVKNITDIVDTDYLHFHKALTEAPSLVDAIDTIAFFKNTQDAAGFTDGETLAFAKFLFDNVNATDDVDGAASILDDQEMQYHKNTTNLAAVTDDFFRMVAYTREYNDAASFTDDDTLNVGKNSADSTNISDIETLASGKYSVDSSVFTDSNTFSFNKPLLDNTLFTDIDILAVGKNTSETVSGITDDETFATVKALADNPLFTETHNFNFGKLLSDTPVMGDVLAIQMLTASTDILNTSDLISVVVNRQILDTASLTDSGLLRSQGYSDFAFFAEDYVGASRNF
jgi:hypothetical protein